MAQSLRIYYQSFVEQLRKVYEEPEAESIAGIVFEEILMMKKHHIFILEKELFDTEVEQLNNILNKLLKHEPVQYVLGIADFFGLRFRVNKNVLIPRRETEELVELIIKEVRGWKQENKTQMNILDIGTGSGCIAITLKRNLPFAHLTAMDVSPGALEVANENAFLNKTHVAFIEDDILLSSSDFEYQAFDIIVSNPPYITGAEKKIMAANVLDYEPHKALFVTNDDPLQFYKAIAGFAQKNLTDNGKLYFEINEIFGDEVKQMLAGKGFKDIAILKDMQGKDRIIKSGI